MKADPARTPAASPAARSLLAARSLDVAAGDRILVRDLDLDARAGEILAVLGRNGAGKTLTLHTLAGLRAPAAGRVWVNGDELAALTRSAVAREVGVLFQDLDMGLATSALDAVLVGRYPHRAAWQWERDSDRRIARAALARVGLGTFETRDTASLSGGEQRRLALAALLAQEPRVFVLDEPTNHLDPHHQLAVFELLRELASDGHAIIATVHDPTLAFRHADRALLLYGDGRWQAGPVGETLTSQSLSELYLTAMTEETVHGRRVFLTL
jgi:iron complex transport system ATP-binding protein